MTTTEQAAAAVRADADRVAATRATLAAEIETLRQSIRAAQNAGIGANEIVRRAHGGLSKASVFEVLGAYDIETAVRQSLQENQQTGLIAVLATSTSVKVAISYDIMTRLADEEPRRWRELTQLERDDQEEYGRRYDDLTHAESITRYNIASALIHNLAKAGLLLSAPDANGPDELARWMAADEMHYAAVGKAK